MENKTSGLFNRESNQKSPERIFRSACLDYKNVTAFNDLKHLAERTNEPIYLYAYYLQTDLESLKQSGILELIENKSIELSGGPETAGARLRINKQFTVEKLLDFWKQHSEILKPIRELDFYFCQLVEVADIQILAGSLYMQNITGLDLNVNEIGTEGAQVLAKSVNLGNLTELNLGGNDIGMEGAQALANSVNLRNLTELYLGGNNIGTEGVQALADSVNLGNLTELDLSWNEIGTEGARALANSENLRNLTKLYLIGNSIGMEGAQALANSENLGNITELYLGENNIGTKIQEQLRQEHPNIQFIF